jgi:outer membrane murein-binding lipoprotein Lpp
VNSCNAATAKQQEATAATNAFNLAEGKLNSRNQELTAAKAEASRTSTLLSEVKANYDSEVASLTQMKDNVLSTTSVAAFRAQVDTLSSQVNRLNSEVNDLNSKLNACKTRVQEFEDAARAASASENTKQTASTDIEDFAPQGLAGTVLVQGICTAIQKSSGWSFAVKRPCGNNDQTCEQVCTSEAQAGSLQPYNAIHMYGNQPTKEAGQPGLKTYRYNSGRGGGGCGPNYCCCGGGGAQALLELGDASSIDEFLQGAEVIDNHSAAVEQASIDQLADKLLGDSDLQMEKVPFQSLAGLVPAFEQFGASGQILAQAACTAINPAQGYTFAIIKGCDVSTDCATLCSQAGRSTGSPSALECKESLHLYQGHSRSQNDLKIYRYFGCGGGCGTNYCCCHGSSSFNLTDVEVNHDDDESDEADSESENQLQVESRTFVSSTAAQVLAESACTAINTAGGWTFAIRRTSTDQRACKSVCENASESQAGPLQCVDSLSIGGPNHPMVDDASRVKLGLMTYRHGNCIAANANYCCCKNR